MSNPFAALLKEDPHTTSNIVCNILENIFGFSLNRTRSLEKRLLYLEEQATTFNTDELNLEILEHALFERLLITDLASHQIDPRESDVSYGFENRVFRYLYECYNSNLSNRDPTSKDVVKSLIMRNALTSLKQPELFSEQDVFAQFYEILKTAEPNSQSFFMDIYNFTLTDDDGFDGAKDVYLTLLKLFTKDIAKFKLTFFDFNIFNLILLMSKHDHLAMTLLESSQPTNQNYSNTLLGTLFCISILPKVSHHYNYDYFQNPIDQASNLAQEGMLQSKMEIITQKIFSLFLSLMKCNTKVELTTLEWLAGCLRSNVDRGKIWSQAVEFPGQTNHNNVSDGFMINFLMVMINFCQPFCSPPTEKRIFKVDPTYCAVSNEDCKAKEIYMLDMQKETCLIPVESDAEIRPVASRYTFATECFYMAHRAFDLGFRVIADKLVKLNQEMVRIERSYNEAVASAGNNSEVANMIKERMQSKMQNYLSIKATLLTPSLLDMLFYLMSGSASWLSQVAINNNFDDDQYAPLTEVDITFPLPQVVPDTLKCIPEFIVENIVCYLIFLRRFNPKLFEIQGYSRLKPFLTFILVYMGSSRRIKNPHLRARLAEALETLLPVHKEETVDLSAAFGNVQREMLFKAHEHRAEIVPSLLEVFVGIEMTGQNVQFEQKFNYRRPMYLVMDYLWELPEHQKYFTQLAEYAEKNMEAVVPPLFLRFVNLLMNDAVYLLDEALTNMAKLKELHAAREGGAWANLPAQENMQNIGYMQHIGMIARFNNILGRDTIRTIVNLTSKITIVFTHPTMVDRVAAMLNYFLLKLVGPSQKDFKVKDYKEYFFEPASTVLDICKIYVHLGGNDGFCLAVSQDGRSYSPQLFKLAEDVLLRIGGGILVGELQMFAERVAAKAAEYQANEEFVAEAPEGYLDPIMSTLMMDPVILPSSKQIVDRTTIARHLLSDQSDPFNRSPLTLDQVITHTELADEIKKWIADRKAGASTSRQN